MVTMLSTVLPGGAAFTIVPRSHHATYAAAARICSLSDLEHYSGELGQAGGPFEALKADPVAVAGIDVSKAVEVPMAEGDCVVFNPMCLVSTSLTLKRKV